MASPLPNEGGPFGDRLARLDAFGQEANTAFETPKQEMQDAPNRYPGIPSDLAQQIILLARGGMSRRKIKDVLGLHGEKYKMIQYVLDKEGL